MDLFYISEKCDSDCDARLEELIFQQALIKYIPLMRLDDKKYICTI